MATKSKPFHTGDVGAKLGLRVIDCETGDPRDLSTATSIEIVFIKPSGEKIKVPGEFADFGGATGDGTDGRIMYVTPNQVFLDECGTWTQQAYITETAGAYSTGRVLFQVNEGACP